MSALVTKQLMHLSVKKDKNTYVPNLITFYDEELLTFLATKNVNVYYLNGPSKTDIGTNLFPFSNNNFDIVYDAVICINKLQNFETARDICYQLKCTFVLWENKERPAEIDNAQTNYIKHAMLADLYVFKDKKIGSSWLFSPIDFKTEKQWDSILEVLL